MRALSVLIREAATDNTRDTLNASEQRIWEVLDPAYLIPQEENAKFVKQRFIIIDLRFQQNPTLSSLSDCNHLSFKGTIGRPSLI